MTETTIRIAPKKIIEVRIRALQNQIAGLKKFLKTEFTNKKQLEAIKDYMTDDAIYLEYSAFIAPSFEKIQVDSVFRRIKKQIKKCEEELTALVTELENYES